MLFFVLLLHFFFIRSFKCSSVSRQFLKKRNFFFRIRNIQRWNTNGLICFIYEVLPNGRKALTYSDTDTIHSLDDHTWHSTYASRSISDSICVLFIDNKKKVCALFIMPFSFPRSCSNFHKYIICNKACHIFRSIALIGDFKKLPFAILLFPSSSCHHEKKEVSLYAFDASHSTNFSSNILSDSAFHCSTVCRIFPLSSCDYDYSSVEFTFKH